MKTDGKAATHGKYNLSTGIFKIERAVNPELAVMIFVRFYYELKQRLYAQLRDGNRKKRDLPSHIAQLGERIWNLDLRCEQIPAP